MGTRIIVLELILNKTHTHIKFKTKIQFTIKLSLKVVIFMYKNLVMHDIHDYKTSR
jgi:hypothetical protein